MTNAVNLVPKTPSPVARWIASSDCSVASGYAAAAARTTSSTSYCDTRATIAGIAEQRGIYLAQGAREFNLDECGRTPTVNGFMCGADLSRSINVLSSWQSHKSLEGPTLWPQY